MSNPIASDLDALRPSLLPSLLAAASRNVARGFPDLQLFEIGAAFQSGMPEAQTTNAAGIITGAGARDWSKSRPCRRPVRRQGGDAGGAGSGDGRAHDRAGRRQGAPAWFHPGRSGTIALGPKAIAQFGELHPKVLAAFDLKVPVAGFEIILDAIPEPKAKGKAQPPLSPSPFQAIERDFAFVVDAKVPAGEIVKAVKTGRSRPDRTVSRCSMSMKARAWREGKKSIAIAVRVQPKDKTLTEAEIEALARKIVAAVHQGQRPARQL